MGELGRSGSDEGGGGVGDGEDLSDREDVGNGEVHA